MKPNNQDYSIFEKFKFDRRPVPSKHPGASPDYGAWQLHHGCRGRSDRNERDTCRTDGFCAAPGIKLSTINLKETHP